MTGPSLHRRPLSLVWLAALLGAAACSEELATSSTCPGLCPEQGFDVQQVELQPVVLDTTVSGFPLAGTESRLLAARMGDTLDTRIVFRFDTLPDRFRQASGDSADITQVLNPVLEVLVLRRGVSYVPEPVTVEVYDVDVAGNDTSTATLAAAFVPGRLRGSATVAVRPAADTTTADSLRIPLAPDYVLDAIQRRDQGRLRLGLRVAGPTDGRVLIPPTQARVVFRAVEDTAVSAFSVPLRSRTPVDQPQLQIDQTSFRLDVRGTPPTEGPVLAVGGLPGQRSLLRFEIPSEILDSSAVVRATLVLTQRPRRGYLPTDTAYVAPLAVTTRAGVGDLTRRLALAANAFNPYTGRPALPTTALIRFPGDTGAFEIPIPELVGAWRTTNGLGFLPELVLTLNTEGASPVQADFFSTEAAPELRPRLRLSYVRRLTFGRP